MILTRYAVCSMHRGKSVTRAVCDSRAEADETLETLRREDGAPDGANAEYWIVPLGPEAEGWRWLAPFK